MPTTFVSSSLTGTTTTLVSVVVGLGFTLLSTYFLGAWDSPPFMVRPTLCWRRNRPTADDGESSTPTAGSSNPNSATPVVLYAIVALSQDKNFAKVIPRLTEQTLTAVQEIDEQGPLALDKGASQYVGTESKCPLGVGLYFDNPAMTDAPRYAIGWVVGCDTWEHAQSLAHMAQERFAADHPERMTAVRIPADGAVLTASIPWRHMLTPALAPTLFGHWQRAYKAKESLGLRTPGPVRGAFDPRLTAQPDASIACEFYVHTKDPAVHAAPCIDYTVLLTDTTQLWSDAFPIPE